MAQLLMVRLICAVNAAAQRAITHFVAEHANRMVPPSRLDIDRGQTMDYMMAVDKAVQACYIPVRDRTSRAARFTVHVETDLMIERVGNSHA